MQEVEEYAKDLSKIVEATKKFNKTINSACGGSLNYGIDKVVESHLSMFDRFCPFKIGDRVMLSKTPDLKNSPGWENSKHFLKRGAGAVIKTRGYQNDKFTFGIILDDESWISTIDSKITPVEKDNRSIYSFTEDSLVSEDIFDD